VDSIAQLLLFLLYYVVSIIRTARRWMTAGQVSGLEAPKDGLVWVLVNPQ
jgi:hypothetical protein